MIEKIEPVKFVQTWDTVAGRKQEYATFITGEFRPNMKALGLEVVGEWYTLMGGRPHVVVESLTESLVQVERALYDEGFREMLGRFMNMVTCYSSCVLAPAEWETRRRGEAPSQEAVKFVQDWDVLPREQEAYDRFTREVYLPQMEAIGLELTSGWHLMIGSGFQVLSESFATDLVSVSKALSNERFLRLIMRMEELVTNYESRILVPHRTFLDVIHAIYGRAIRAVAPDEMYSMVGPVID